MVRRCTYGAGTAEMAMKTSPQRHCVDCGAKVIGRRLLCLDCADLKARENKRLKDARRPGRGKSVINPANRGNST